MQMCPCLSLCRYVSICMHVCLCECVCVNVCKCSCLSGCICVCVPMCACVCVCARACMRARAKHVRACVCKLSLCFIVYVVCYRDREESISYQVPCSLLSSDVCCTNIAMPYSKYCQDRIPFNNNVQLHFNFIV